MSETTPVPTLPHDTGFAGRVALVTGGTGGIGGAVAIALAQRGARVVAADIGVPAQAAVDGFPDADCTDVHLDVTSKSEVTALVARMLAAFGRIDLLVNVAGVVSRGSAADLGEDEWDRVMRINLKGTFLCSQAVMPAMKAQRFGRIAQIVSIAGLEVVDNLILSNASRPAVLGFAKALAREVAADNILVNSICPGIFMTDRMEQLATARCKERGITREQYLAEFAGGIPAGRTGDPREVGDLAAFLCSPRNTYITGAAIPIDGGKTLRLF